MNAKRRYGCDRMSGGISSALGEVGGTPYGTQRGCPLSFARLISSFHLSLDVELGHTGPTKD